MLALHSFILTCPPAGSHSLELSQTCSPGAAKPFSFHSRFLHAIPQMNPLATYIFINVGNVTTKRNSKECPLVTEVNYWFRYNGFLCRFSLSLWGGTSTELVLLEKALNGRLRIWHEETKEFGLLSTRRSYGFIFSCCRVNYFRIAHFPISHILGAKPPRRISKMAGSIFTRFQDMIAQSSTQNNFMLWFRKIALFRNGGHPIRSGVDKTAQNESKFCDF